MGKIRTGKQNKKKTRTKHQVSVFTWLAIFLAGMGTLLCALFFIFRWGINSFYVAEAKKGKYHSEMESFLTLFDQPDGYVIWYNIGNYHYENGEYKEAEEAYRKAIECGIPYEKECPVRVNLALSMLEQISDEEWDEFIFCTGPGDMNALSRKVEKTLLDARDILMEDGCAGEEDEPGHDKQAQKLKDEIDELLEQSSLDPDDGTEEEQPAEEPEDDGDDGDDEWIEVEPVEPGDSLDEDFIIDYIQDQLDDNQGERIDEQTFYENFYGLGSDGQPAEGQQGEVW